MRSTIACERKSKVKCHHDGKPPCRGCVKSKNTTSCVLSGPVLSRPPATQKPRHQLLPLGIQSSSLPPSSSRVARNKHAAFGVNGGGGGDDDDDDDEVSRLFDRVPVEHVARATAVFQAQFPEFGFLHPRDHDSRRDDAPPNAVDKLRCLAILSVALRYLDDGGAGNLGGSSGKGNGHVGTSVIGVTSAECADVVTRELHSRLTTVGAGPVLVQTYLIMALRGWGEGDGFSAWMYAGIAARMAQGCIMYPSLSRGTDAAGGRGAKGLGLSEPSKRTVWSCFALDKLLSCGTQRPAAFRLEDMRLPLPISDEDYAFDADAEAVGPTTAHAPPFSNELLESSDAAPFGPSDYFSIVLQGLHIWARIHTWVVEGGRKRPGMTEPHNSPWRQGSEWARMKASVMRWRARQPPRMRYPETKASAHAHLRRGEMFGYINLIYYLSLAFLCREYVPFLPLEEIVPRGPIDPPLLKEYAPEGFWLRNRDEVIDAAAQMSNLMRDLRLAGTPLRTPFTGLCAFVAALMNRYAVSFAQFAGPGFPPAVSEQRATESAAELRRICELWPGGQGWLEVLDTAERLYRQVTSPASSSVADRIACAIDTRRDNHLELEASINLGPLSGMPTPHPHPRPHLDQPRPPYPHPHTRQRLDEDAGGGGAADESARTAPAFLDLDPELCSRLENDGADAEGWRLWAFWDDPHILSTAAVQHESDPGGAMVHGYADQGPISPEEAIRRS